MEHWDAETDVVVVGFGGAGVCAALEARDRGAEVIAVDRFEGGGSTVISGGNIYSGGGTAQQKEAGYDESADNFYNYLKLEVGDAVSDELLRDVCNTNVADMEWLESQGVRFNGNACPYKTSYPVDKYYLYYSGNEIFRPYTDHAEPAPRGHRAYGEGGMAGANLFNPLKKTALEKGVQLRTQSTLQRIIQDDEGRVVGVEVTEIPSGMKRTLHRLLARLELVMRFAMIGFPPLVGIYRKLYELMETKRVTTRIRAEKGVLIATGGFAFNKPMLTQYAPKWVDGTPLGKLSDDGSGIMLGHQAGGQLTKMDRVSAWRFINPPMAFCKGVLVGKDGKRICNEAMYGAHIGEHMTMEHDGYAYLIYNDAIFQQAKKDLKPEYAQWFQSFPIYMNLYISRKKGKTLEELAGKVGIDPNQLRETMAEYNRMADDGSEDPLNKSREFIQRLDGPYMAVDCSLGSKSFDCPIITFGGLKVDEWTGEVLDENDSPISGLYGAGRSTASFASNMYVSGLSITDCVYGGRRAARHMMREP